MIAASPSLKINSENDHDYFSDGLSDVFDAVDSNVTITLDRPTTRSEVLITPWMIKCQKCYVRHQVHYVANIISMFNPNVLELGFLAAPYFGNRH